MTITVIEMNTAERKAETQELYQLVKPYLDKGYSLRQAVIQVKDIYNKTNLTQYAWYRELREYVKEAY